MLWIRAPGARAQGQGSVQPLRWSRGQSLRKGRTPLPLPPTPTGPKPPGHVPGHSSAHHPAQQQPHQSSRARESHCPQPPPLLPACLPVPTQAHSPGIARSGWNWGDSGHDRGPPPGPAAAQPPLASPMAMRVLQSFLWKSDQALVLQYLLQARIP